MKLKNIGQNCQLVSENIGEIYGTDTLFSYGVPVARYQVNGFLLGEKWDYSRTTAKHVSQFLGMTAKEIREKIKKGEFQVINLED